MSASLIMNCVEEVEEPLHVLKSKRTKHSKPRQRHQLLSTIPIQEVHKKVPRRKVSFNMDVDVIDFSISNPPLLTVKKIPSTIDSLTVEQLDAEAVNLQVVKSSCDINSSFDYDTFKNDLKQRWCNNLIREIEKYNINLDASAPYNIIELQYTLYKSILRSAVLLLFHPSLFPQDLTQEELVSECNKYNLVSSNIDRDSLIRDLENYLIVSIPGAKGTNYAFGKVFMTAKEMYTSLYSCFSASDISKVITNHGEKPPKKIEKRKDLLVQLLEREMKDNLTQAYHDTLLKCLQFRHIQIESNSIEDNTLLFQQLFNYKINNHETIVD